MDPGFEKFLKTASQPNPVQVDAKAGSATAAQSANKKQSQFQQDVSDAAAAAAPKAPDFDEIWKTYGKDIKKAAAVNEDSIEIFPQPQYVAKVWLKPNKQKMFINVCSEPAIEGPSERVDPKTGETQLRIPVSCGEQKPGVDKQGQPVVIFDVVFNDELVRKAVALVPQDQGDFRNYITQFAVQNLVAKHKLEVEDRIKFPQLRYKGTGPPPPQRIRRPKKKLVIEEVVEQEDEEVAASKKQKKLTATSTRKVAKKVASAVHSKPTSAASATTAAKSSSTPPVQADTAAVSNDSSAKAEPKIEEEVKVVVPVYALQYKSVTQTKSKTLTFLEAETLYNDPDISHQPHTLILSVQLPEVEAFSQLEVQVGEGDIYLTALDYKLYVVFPCLVDPVVAKAKFDKNKHKLKLTLKVTGLHKTAVRAEAEKRRQQTVQKPNAAQKASAPAGATLQLTNTTRFQLCDVSYAY